MQREIAEVIYPTSFGDYCDAEMRTDKTDRTYLRLRTELPSFGGKRAEPVSSAPISLTRRTQSTTTNGEIGVSEVGSAPRSRRTIWVGGAT